MFFFLDDTVSSVFIHDDPTSRGPTAVTTDATAAGPQSPAAPSAAPAAESTHVTPGNVCLEQLCVLHPHSPHQTQCFYSSLLNISPNISAATNSRGLQESARAAKYPAAATEECWDC